MVAKIIAPLTGANSEEEDRHERVVRVSEREEEMGSQTEREELLNGLAEAVLTFDEEKSAHLARIALARGIDPRDAILSGLAHGMEEAGELYEKHEYFVPELLGCADALNAALDVLKPHIKAESQETRVKVVIGTVEGDIHEIGKNLVRIMYEAAGWEVYDLGCDVKIDRYLEEQQKTGSDVIAISALMTTSMLAIAEVVKRVKAYDSCITVVAGGAPLTREISRQYGADGYADNCSAAVKETLEALHRVRRGGDRGSISSRDTKERD